MVKENAANWTTAQEAILVDILKRAKEEGLMADNGFKSVVYERVATALDGTEKASGGGRIGAKQVKSRFQRFKAEYRDVKKLRELSGFGWDDSQHIVTATEDVWRNYLAVHKTAEKWRKKNFPLYDDLAYLIEGIVADGRRAFRPSQNTQSDVSVAPAVAAAAATGETVLSAVENAELSDDDITEVSENKTTSEPTQRQPAPEPIKKKVRQSGAAAIFALSESIDGVVSAISTTSEASTSQYPVTSPQRKTAAIRVIEEDEGLSDTEMADVADMIRQHTDIADAYLALTKKSTRSAYLRKALDKYADM